ncbi:ABC transporter substrate-binding protein [Metapseudomonas otitidis]|uniref:ABC transporter substrate-binding protein n=1 Tax=Metapseudomonas otitidis TaxID=319939 RepID=UPI0013F69C69|nr:ABC transporter substrate-binding protein [Pseudomonas otitidis]
MLKLMAALWLTLGVVHCAVAEQTLRILTWEGYVSAKDLVAINHALAEQGLPVKAEVITPYAEGPEQMFMLLRSGRADLSFLTLNYLKMQQGRMTGLLQPIDPTRLKRFKQLLPQLAHLDMGMDGDRLLYVPFGGGTYGIWANMQKLNKDELPRHLGDLLQPRWKGKLSLTSGQVQPNVALAFLALGDPPFLLHDLMRSGKRKDAKRLAAEGSPAQDFLNRLYGQVDEFWVSAPQFRDKQLLVASYGPEIAARRARGENWQRVEFAEGDTAWLDTMNIVKGVSGEKLQSAYLVIDYFLSEEVQRRVVRELNMVAVVSTVDNPMLANDPKLFSAERFWPAYDRTADNLMHKMSMQAMRVRSQDP